MESKPGADILFRDDFERNKLGEMYENFNPDPKRLAVANGQLLIVASPRDQGEIPKNLILLQRKFPGNFIATVRVTMQVTEKNSVKLVYWLDSKNSLSLGVYGFKATGSEKTEGRHIGFTKFLNGEPNRIWQFYSDPRWQYLGSLGGRYLKGYATQPEVWYFQLSRKDLKYTGGVSIDGVEWYDVGTHTILDKEGRLGFSVESGNGIENVAEFDDFGA